ncbi:MAG: hypothetical protein HY072_09625 [Deltaproteobacteria bacterium]|nr:hypothetical protein [Deltaproteobacteria bacterium]
MFKKKNVFIGVVLLSVIGAVGAGTYYFYQEKQKQEIIKQGLESTFSKLSFLNDVFAAASSGQGDQTCQLKAQEAMTSCFKKNTAYLHGALNFFHGTLCMLNKGFPAFAETALCHFNKSMEMNPDKTSLPITIEKTFGGSKTVKLVVEKPTESFATTLGYDAKGTVIVNGSTFMVLYWGGTDESSNGFLIEGGPGMGGEGNEGLSRVGKTHRSYIQWSRTDATNQFIKVFVTAFTTSYLASFESPSAANPMGGDRAMYGKATYNSTTKTATAQIVAIEAQRARAAGCFKMFAEGTMSDDGTVTIAKTKNAFSATGHLVTSTSKDNTDMDAFQGIRSPTTANGTGNLAPGQFGGLTVAFDKSCNDIYTAGNTGGAFDGGNVSFTKAPADIFP